ncbi:MAG TPA: 4-(cytidine 5'-diphospho)-2-C-methyl-D-erythritol kinase [Candidatus Limnocylindrales bacterium]
MHARPRAKVNLTLRVGARGRDGYHELESTFLRIGLADELTVAFGNGLGADVLTVSGLPGADVSENIILRAFDATRQTLGQELPPLVAHLDKRIPVAGGLGGGSADAACAVDCALQMWGAALSPALLADVAVELGADVPFFTANAAAALVRGRGEQIEVLPEPRNDIGLLIVTPPIAISTAAAFARFDELDLADQAPAHDTPDLNDLAACAEQLRDANDLWPAVITLAPELAVLRDELERLSHRPWLMSGSGSTLFAIYRSAAESVASARSLVASESEVLGGALFNAVDLVGPDPLWRYP